MTNLDLTTAVAVLEKAKQLCDQYPGLAPYYAIGFYVLDDRLMHEYAQMFQCHNIFAGLPEGVDKAEFERVAKFFDDLYKFLVPYKIYLTISSVDTLLAEVRGIVAKS